MRGLTSQCAADLKFLLNGKDGKADRMVTVEAYMKGEKQLFLSSLTMQSSMATLSESHVFLVSSTAPSFTCRELVYL